MEAWVRQGAGLPSNLSGTTTEDVLWDRYINGLSGLNFKSPCSCSQRKDAPSQWLPAACPHHPMAKEETEDRQTEETDEREAEEIEVR